jgi:hypothetical protein
MDAVLEPRSVWLLGDSPMLLYTAVVLEFLRYRDHQYGKDLSRAFSQSYAPLFGHLIRFTYHCEVIRSFNWRPGYFRNRLRGQTAFPTCHPVKNPLISKRILSYSRRAIGTTELICDER